MTEAKLLKAVWRLTEAGRRARFYELTAKGRRKLEADEKRWRSVSAAVAKVLRTAQ
jgi:DNA-binding PadR family transcriptional regulator